MLVSCFAPKGLLYLRVKKTVRFFFQRKYKAFLPKIFECALLCIKLYFSNAGMLHLKYLRHVHINIYVGFLEKKNSAKD